MPTKPLTIEGIIAAVPTAFDATDEVDWKAQSECFRRVAASGVQGLFVGGTTAEFHVLDLAEREKLVEAAIEAVGGRLPILVHVGAPRPRDAARLARHAEKAGAVATSAVPPYYFSQRESAVLEYVREVAAASSLPFLFYHIPSRTHFDVDEPFAERLAAVPGVAGMKYSHGDLFLQARILAVAGAGFRIYCGSDEILLSSLLAGACGAVGSSYNFLAPVFTALWRAFRAGRTNEASSQQIRANKVLAVLARYPSIAGTKEAMRHLGIPLGEPRRPLVRLEPAEREALGKELLAADLLAAAGVESQAAAATGGR
jgi:N-acetylneuraminate lyase